MDDFLNANNSERKDLIESNPRISDEQDVVITSSGIPFSQIFVSSVIYIIFKKHSSRREGHVGYKWK